MKKLGNQIKKVLVVDKEDFIIQLKFQDNVVVRVSLSFIFKKPKNLAAEIIRGDLFAKCFIEGGALAWPNGFELCPDMLRFNAMAFKKTKLQSRKK